MPFSTIDRIHDPLARCQRDFHLGQAPLAGATSCRGWWTRYCGLASLNGEYHPLHLGRGYGLFFTVAGLDVLNPRQTRMLIRDQRPRPQ